MNVGTRVLFRYAAAFSIVVALLAVSTFAFFSKNADAATGINQQMNFQGRLLNAQGATVPDGYYNIQFKIYQDGDGQTPGNTTGSPAGTLKWTESHLNASGKGVQVKNGFMSVQLGSVSAFGTSVDWNQDTIWLSMNIGNTNASCTPFSACGGDGEMVPMKRMSSTAYALNAGQLGGKTAGDFIQNTSTIQNANIAIQSASVGNVAAVIQGATSQTADIFQIKSSGVSTPLLAVKADGSIAIQPVSDSGSTFNIKSSVGGNVLTVDTLNSRVGIGLAASNTPSLTGQGLEVQGALKLSGGTGSAMVDNFITPMGSSVQTKINIPLYFVPQFAQVLAVGAPAGSDATARVVSLFDGRTGVHQPTLSVFSPNENSVFGLSWDGSNSTGYLKNTANAVALQANGLNIFTVQNTSGVGSASIGGNTSVTGTISATSTIQGTQLISSATTGTAPITVSSTTKVSNLNSDLLDGLDSTAFAAASGSNSYIQNQTATPQTASFNISGSAAIQGELTSIGTANINTSGAAATTIGNSGAALSITGTGSTASSNILSLRVSGDTNDRFTLGADGKLSFGSGAAASDVSIARSGANSIAVTSTNFTGTGTANFNRLASGTNLSGQYKLSANNEGGAIANIVAGLRGAVGQTGDMLQFQVGSTGAVLSGVNASGQFYTKSGTYSGTIVQSTLSTINRTYSLPDETGTFCMQSSTSCGFAAASGSANYIQNQTASAQAAGFNINGAATIGGGLSVLGTTTVNSSGSGSTTIGNSSGALSITGTGATTATTIASFRVNGDANARFVINADGKMQFGSGAAALDASATLYRTAVNTLKTDGALTASGSLSGNSLTATNQINAGTSLQTGGTTRIDSSGNLTNIGTITSGLINGQTISSTANFTGSVTAATSLIAPTIQSASGDLTIRSASDRVVISDANATTALMLVLDSSSNDPTGVAGAMYYNTGLGKMRCYENGVWKDCVSAPGIANVGTIDSQTKSADGAVIVGNSIYLQTADASNPGIVSTAAQTFAGVKTFSANMVVNAATGFSGNLVDLRLNNVSKFSVSDSGAVNAAGSISATGNINTSGSYQIGTSTVLSSSSLTFTAPSTASVQAAAGQSLNIQAGAASTLNTNGGSIAIAGGAGNGTGVKGLVSIGPSAQAAVTNATCSVDCTITQANIDNYGTVIINSSGTDLTITLPAPTITTTPGRTIYVTTASGSQDFTLRTNSGGNLIDVAMRQNTTSTMIWNGSAWTPGGASNATTLQATYNNGSNPATTPEIKLDSVRGTIDIQDADTSIGTDILNIRGSNASGLGTVLFGVGDTGRVTIQGTTDQSSAFRVLGSNGDYLFNINSSNSYVISNATRAPGNEISNPGFETGGLLTSGEEGWFGPAIGSINNDATNAKAGNYVLAVTANSSNSDFYAGKYYEVAAGDNLYFEGWVKNSAGANGNAGIQITWYTKDKAIISNSTGYPNNPGTSYVLRTVSATAPAGAHYARVSATIRSNVTTGTYYFDNFYMKRSLENADMLFKNSVDSSTAFRIQSAGAAQTIFTANTLNNTVKIGDNTGSGVNTTLLVLDSATSDPSVLTGLNGGIFYRSDNNSLKAIVGGAVVDICTTAVTCSGYSASAGSAIALQGSSPGTQQVGNFNITGTGILTQLQTMDNAAGNTQGLTIRTGNATGGNSGDLLLDVGTASGTKGKITIGSSNVSTFMPGRLAIQGSNTLTLGSELGTSSPASGSILFKTAAGANTVTLKAPASNPSASYTLSLPTLLGGAGECLKTDAGGNTYFQGCGVGVNFNLQDAYNNSETPAAVTLADGKNLEFIAQETAGTDPSVVVNLQCITGCSQANGTGRFAVQNSGVDVFTVSPNGAGIVLGAKTQIGSSVTNSTETLFQLDSYNGTSDDPTQGCSDTVNQGAMYYNTSMGSIRSCINGSWSDVSNPDTLGLLTFGIVPSSGGQPYDLPALINNGSSGPCKVSWASTNSVSVQACTAYSNGRRLAVPARTLTINNATLPNTSLTTGARWGHICISPTTGEPAFTANNGTATPTANMPTFSAATPILCLADVVSTTTTNGVIDDIYDTRTFTSAMKEAVILSTATELGMTVDAGSNGAMTPAVAASAKLYGTVVATDGGTSAGAPNAIVTTVGPAWVKSTAGSAGQFVKTATPNGYSNTTTAIPNNSFYYSVGNTRTNWSSTCTAASNCAGSLYVNFIVR